MSSLLALLVLLLSIVTAALPTAIYVLLLWRIDRYEREPIPLLTIAFLWGAVPAIAVSAIIEIATDTPVVAFSQGYHELVSASFVAPPVEELVKGLALLGLLYLAKREFDDALDGIIYGSIIGFGFAMTENAFYFFGAWQESGLAGWSKVVLVRALAFGLSHAMFTSLTGIGFGLARYEKSRFRHWGLIVSGLLAATTAHFLHNFFLSIPELCLLAPLVDWAGIIVVLVVMLLAWRRERVWIETHLAEEVSLGVLSQAQYQTIASRRHRLKHQWQLLGISGLGELWQWRRLVDTATELAFKKHQLSKMGDENRNVAAIEALRARIIGIRQSLGDNVTASALK